MNLEEQVNRVWNPDIRPLAAEAYRCYSSGAARACIALTWIAVCSDLLEKLQRLAEDGESGAKQFTDKIEAIRGNVDATAIKTLQDAEREILNKAIELELVDSMGKRELERIKEDRNLSAHPSLRPLGEFYEPRLEYARAHLVSALDILLIHPPSQGRRAVQRFADHVADSSFTGSAEYLTHVFFDRVRAATRRSIVDLAVKHALLELDAPTDPPGSVTLADRMAACVYAFVVRDRSLVADSMRKSIERLRDLPGEKQMRAIFRFPDLDVFWEAVDEPTRNQFDSLIKDLSSIGPYDELDINHASRLACVAAPAIRGRLPGLFARFLGLSGRQKATVIGLLPTQYFAEFVPELLKDAVSYRTAEYVTQRAVVPCGAFLTLQQLQAALDNWANNGQCRQAGGMPDMSLELFAVTDHLWPGSRDMWLAFVQQIQEKEGLDSYYSYTDLERAITDHN